MNHDIRRQKQQALMTELLEKKIRLHAQDLYDKRGQAEGSALEDWVQAESQVLEKSILAPLYRKRRAVGNSAEGPGDAKLEDAANPQLASPDRSTSEAGT